MLFPSKLAYTVVTSTFYLYSMIRVGAFIYYHGAEKSEEGLVFFYIDENLC